MDRRTFCAALPALAMAGRALARPTGASAAKFARLASAARGQPLVLAVHALDGHADTVRDFQRAFPEVRVAFSEMSMNAFGPRVITEQRNGIFHWDVVWGATQTLNSVVVPAGAFQPIVPFFTLPEVAEPRYWRVPTQFLFSDPARPLLFFHSMQLDSSIYANRERLGPAGLHDLGELLRPDLKGRISVRDPALPGNGAHALAAILRERGEPFVRQVLTRQNVLLIANPRQVTDTIIRGRSAVVIGGYENIVGRCQTLGGCRAVFKPEIGARYVLPRGIGVLRRAPNPAAARLFVNWLLSREGQESFVRNWAGSNFGGASSLRVDVATHPGHAETVPDYARIGQYLILGTTAGDRYMDQIKAIAQELFGW